MLLGCYWPRVVGRFCMFSMAEDLEIVINQDVFQIALLQQLDNNILIDSEQVMSHLNKIIRHKMKDQSHFRVHFYLRNVYYDFGQTLQNFLQNVSNKVSKFAAVSHIQATLTPRKGADISIGLHSDLSACSLIESGKKVMLAGQNNQLAEHEITMGEGFRSYYRAWKEGRLQRRKSEKVSNRQQKSSSSSNEKEQKYQQRRFDRDSNVAKSVYEEMRQVDSPKTNWLWVFCIPLEIKERDVCALLSEKKMHPKGYEWKLKEDMEYLQIELYESATHREIEAMDLKIDKYPLLVLPKLLDSNNINQHILRHEMEISFEKEIDEFKLIRMMDRIGGVLAFVKDQYYGQHKYVIALNSWAKIDRLNEQLQKNFTKVVCTKPRYVLRLCRVQKNFTFSQIAENISYIQSQY